MRRAVAWIATRLVSGVATIHVALAACGGGEITGPASDGSAERPDAPSAGFDSGGDPDAGPTADAPVPGDVTVYPTRIDDVLVNPGMGATDFHLGWWCNLPPVTFTPEECADRVRANWPASYPPSATAYFRWHWRDLEPVRGQIDFDMIDTAIQSANALGETLSFRVMAIDEGAAGVPDWLMADPYNVAGAWLASGAGSTFWPDVRDPTFLAEHARFVTALANRYDDHPGVDHVDIGSIGCWGEWNTACLTDVPDIIEVYNPTSELDRDAIAAAYDQIVDDFNTVFTATPVVMLGIGSGGGRELDVMVHAMQGGAGWRVDCWGDWDLFSTSWSHQDTIYPDMIDNVTAAYVDFPEVWQHAPVQLEICGTMPGWLDAGYTTDAPDGEVYRSFQWALAQHASVLNFKSTDMPVAYVSAVDDLLRENGYRYVIDSVNHASAITPGGALTFIVTWSNLGVAPIYHRRALTYRLRGENRTVIFTSPRDTRAWLPGSWEVIDSFTVPADLPIGDYAVDIGLLDRPGVAPSTPPLAPLYLGIEGRGIDGWYALSTLTVE